MDYLGTLNCTYEGFVSVVAIVGSFRTGSAGCWAAAAVSGQIAQKVMAVVVAAVESVPSAQITQWVAAVVVSEVVRIEMTAEVAVPGHSGQIETAAAAAAAAIVYFAQRIPCFAEPAESVVFGQISSFQPGLGFVCSH